MMRATSPRVRFVSALLAIWVLSASCASNKGAPKRTSEGGKAPVIYTTSYPMQYFAERISRGKVPVVCPVPGDQAALLRTINAEVIQAYQNADLIVINGAGYENWIEMVFLAESKIVDTAKPFENEFIVSKEVITHSHGPSGAHAHGGVDGHTWLDPVYAKIQAEEIKKAMVKHFPAHAAEFEAGFSSLAKDLDDLDRQLGGLSKAYDGQPILASHPSYKYIARRYKWNIVNLDVGLDPTEMPDDGQLAEIKVVLEAHPAKYILWETYPNAEIARRLQDELGLKNLQFRPCKELGEEDIRSGLHYMKIMEDNIANIREIFAPHR